MRRPLLFLLFLAGACQEPAPTPKAPAPHTTASPSVSASAEPPPLPDPAPPPPPPPPPPPTVFPSLPREERDLPKTPEGAARSLGTMRVEGSIPELFEAWKAQAATSNWSVQAQYEGRVSSWIVFSHASGARAFGSFSGGGPFTASLSIVPRPRKAIPMPGPCVPIPSKRQSAGGITMEVHSNGQAELLGAGSTFETSYERDLDGDGFPDAIVPLGKGKQCPEEFRFAVYITRGDCGHHVGVVGPGKLMESDLDAAPDPRGLKPLTYVFSLDPSRLGANARTTRTFRFTGKSYGIASFQREEISCSHCPTWFDGCVDVTEL